MDEYWLEEFRRMAVATGRRGIALDIGANAGDWSAWMAMHYQRVIAIDADHRCIEPLRRRFVGSMDACNVEVMHAAVSRGVGETTLFLRPDTQQTSLLEVHPIGGAGQAPAEPIHESTVPTISLDAIGLQVGEDIDLIKLDVEGAEGDVLAGATLPMFRRCRWIIEVHDTSDAVRREVERLGYANCHRVRHPAADAHPGHYWIYMEAAT